MIESKPLVWKSKEGFATISDMSDEHIQAALITAEHSYMNYNNLAVKLSLDAEYAEQKLETLTPGSNKALRNTLYIKKLERKSVRHTKTSALFYNLIKGFHTEAGRRGITLVSLADRDAGRFSILRSIPK